MMTDSHMMKVNMPHTTLVTKMINMAGGMMAVSTLIAEFAIMSAGFLCNTATVRQYAQTAINAVLSMRSVAISSIVKLYHN